jgi:hypothetical protein
LPRSFGCYVRKQPRPCDPGVDDLSLSRTLTMPTMPVQRLSLVAGPDARPVLDPSRDHVLCYGRLDPVRTIAGGGQTIKLVVLGLGYDGLPLAREAVPSRHQVTRPDTSAPLVEVLNRATSQVDHRRSSDVRAMLEDSFGATTDLALLAKADVVACTLTLLQRDGGPDRWDAMSSEITLERWVHEDRDRR